MIKDIINILKPYIDWTSIVTTVGALVSWFPAIAGALGIAWWCYRIYETRLSIKLIKKQLGE
jgi:hypothetical protein